MAVLQQLTGGPHSSTVVASSRKAAVLSLVKLAGDVDVSEILSQLVRHEGEHWGVRLIAVKQLGEIFAPRDGGQQEHIVLSAIASLLADCLWDRRQIGATSESPLESFLEIQKQIDDDELYQALVLSLSDESSTSSTSSDRAPPPKPEDVFRATVDALGKIVGRIGGDEEDRAVRMLHQVGQFLTEAALEIRKNMSRIAGQLLTSGGEEQRAPARTLSSLRPLFINPPKMEEESERSCLEYFEKTFERSYQGEETRPSPISEVALRTNTRLVREALDGGAVVGAMPVVVGEQRAASGAESEGGEGAGQRDLETYKD